MKETTKSRCLVLEGGGMRGMYTAGVLDVFMEHKITMDAAVGVSAGAVFGCNYKSGQIGRAIRYNKRFCRDKRFVGIRNWIKTGDLYSRDFAYGEVPWKLDPFDSRAYAENPMKFYVVCTDTKTGKPHYVECKKGDYDDVEWMRASASIPVVSRPVEIGGGSYLDGGASDSIPARWMAEQGYDKMVVIVTRDRAYRKEPRKGMGLIRRMLKNTPAVADAIEKRHLMYNETIEWINKKEAEGELFVIRPSTPIKTAIIERSPEHLQRIYELGREDAISHLSDMKKYLELN